MVENKDKKIEKKEEVKMETEVKTDKKENSKVETPVVKKAEPKKKDVAVANGFSLRISPKHSFAVCKIVKGKSPEDAVKRLEDVLAGRRAVPMASREVAHQKGKGLAGAKFPKKACEDIIRVVKQVEANASVAGIEDPIITIAMANQASAPYRRGGRKAKRTHVHLEVRAKNKLVEKKK